MTERRKTIARGRSWAYTYGPGCGQTITPGKVNNVTHRPTLQLVPNCGSALMSESSLPDGIDVRAQRVTADSGRRLNGKRQPRTGLAPLGGDLPQISGVRLESLGERLPAGHVIDIGLEVHTPQTIALCYPFCNSSLQADKNSSLLHHSGVSIKELETARRANLAKLRKEVGPAELSRLTEIPVSMLYQMSEGRGKSFRNVNDNQARLIESKAGKPEYWLDRVEGVKLDITPKPKQPKSEWPFPFSPSEWLLVNEEARNTLIATAANFVQTAKASARPRRRAGKP